MVQADGGSFDSVRLEPHYDQDDMIVRTDMIVRMDMIVGMDMIGALDML